MKQDPQESNVKGMIAGAAIFGMSVAIVFCYITEPIRDISFGVSLIGIPFSLGWFVVHSRAYTKQLSGGDSE